ncbi:hypothetical protein [Dokdonia sp.]|uniref:ABC transporter permease n=1 Tax=Dokdonia sp. TaxID=2024995 RepID=UPI0032647802
MMINRKNIIWLNGLILVLILWYLSSSFDWIDNTLLASPMETLDVIKKSFDSSTPVSGRIFLHASYTIKISLIGWGISLLIGTILGLLFGFVKYLMRSFEITLEFFRAIPPILAFPLMLVSFNYEDSAYVWTIVFGCLPIMILTVSKGVEYISNQSIEILKVYSVKPTKIIMAKAIEMLPSIFLGARVTFSFALIISVVTEMVLTPKNGLALGALARDAEINFQTPVFYAVLLLLGFLGFFINLLLKRIERLFGVKQLNS